MIWRSALCQNNNLRRLQYSKFGQLYIENIPLAFSCLCKGLLIKTRDALVTLRVFLYIILFICTYTSLNVYYYRENHIVSIFHLKRISSVHMIP